MATLQELETALINADKAGDTEAAQALANAVREMRAKQGFVGQLGAAEEAQSRAQMTHNAPPTKPKDMYAQQAGKQSFGENFLAGAGGAMYGLGNLGPRSLVGMAEPGEVADWKASMAGLRTTAGGNVGQFVGGSAPFFAAAPLIGTSVPAAGLVGLGEGLLQPAESWSERGINAGLNAAGALGGQMVGSSLGKGLTARQANKAAENAKEKAMNAVKDETMRRGREAGMVLPPSAAGRPSMLESVGGQIKTQQAAAWRNQRAANKLARKALGLGDDAPLTSDTMKQVRQEAGKAYADIANLGPQYAGAVEGLKQARFEAHKAMSNARMTGNPEALAEAQTARQIATQLEDAMENSLQQSGQSALLDNFRNARRRIAMSYDVQDALVEATGDVRASVVARAYDEGMKGLGPRLTGELETLGRFAQAFPQQTAWRSFQPLPNSALDAGTATLAIGAGQGHPAALAAAAIPYTRDPVRNYLLRDAYQNALMTPRYDMPLTSYILPGLLDNPVSRRIYPGLGLFGVTSQTESQ